MPTVARWHVRASLVALVAGAALGAAGLLATPWPAWSSARALLPLHRELLTIGWAVQLALGVAHWILPRPPGGVRPPEGAREVLVFVLLNGGIAAAGLGGSVGAPPLVLVGRTAELAALGLFALAAWPRVRAASWPPRGTA